VSVPKRDQPDPARQIVRECLAVRVGLLHRVVARAFDDALNPLGITGNQLGILAMLESTEDAGPGDIGRRLRMDKSTVSRGVERMLRNGWLQEQPGADARRVVLTVTPAGRAVLRKAFPFWAEAQEQVRTVLGDAGASAVAAMAERFLKIPGEK
jgi:DNA-binding MarR family transcriptional regulator